MYKTEGGDEQRERETGTDRDRQIDRHRDRETKPEVKKDMRILTTSQPWRYIWEETKISTK